MTHPWLASAFKTRSLTSKNVHKDFPVVLANLSGFFFSLDEGFIKSCDQMQNISVPSNNSALTYFRLRVSFHLVDEPAASQQN